MLVIDQTSNFLTDCPTPGQIIILNGVPRSGKSSIAREIQASFPGLWLNLGVDVWIQATPPHLRPGIGLRPGQERPDLEPTVGMLYRSLYETAALQSRLGINVVMDVGHHNDLPNSEWPFDRCYSLLSGLPVLLVAVRCDPVEITRRRIASDTMPKDLSTTAAEAKFADWDAKVHDDKRYDFEVNNTSRSPSECAADIQTHLPALHNG